MSYRVEKWKETFAPDPAMLRDILESEGYNVHHWSDQAGTVYMNHMHREDQSHWVISGRLELSIQNVGTFVLEAGDRDMMPAGTYHSARVIGDEAVVYLIGEKR